MGQSLADLYGLQRLVMEAAIEASNSDSGTGIRKCIVNEASVYFKWDAEKAAANLRKHGVSFEEAASAFEDSLANVLQDPDHSVDEHRLLLLGESRLGRTLMVAFTERVNVIRIISARVATRRERQDYEESAKV